MIIKRFEDIIAWQKAQILSLLIYTSMRDNKDWGFRDQIQRASVSIMNNIAEGFERRTNKEFIAFLYIAKGSCGEVRSMLYIGRELKYIPNDQFTQYIQLATEISKLISGFIKTL
ncbi:four helix bundle protein [Candidatus Falkowbacteria bacterium]|nr:four helix bundle protein [Candidatus Falkowbacteria bacterium]